MAIAKIRLKNGEVRYRVRGLRGPDGKRVPQRSFRRKEDAVRHETELASARDRGDWVDPAGAKLKLKEFIEEWLGQKVVSRRTFEKIAGRVNNHILPVFGDSPLGAIKSGQVKEWRAGLIERGLAPTTVNAYLGTLKEILNAAVLDELIRRNPTAGIKALTQKSSEEVHFLTPEQVAALADAIHPRFSTLVYTAAYTGMRWGELAGLPESNLLLTRFANRIKVDRSLIEYSDGTLEIGPTKTGKARTVNLPPSLARRLQEHLKSGFGWKDLVFSSAGRDRSDRYLRHSNFYRRHFKPALIKAGLDPAIRFHDLRHTAASWLIADGANPKQIMGILGHSTIRVTFDRYGHLFEGHDEDLIQKLEKRYLGDDTRRPEDTHEAGDE